jgi:uncharacterized membrane protein YqjE
MKCLICQHDTIRWWHKLWGGISGRIQCHHCNARFKLTLFRKKLSRTQNQLMGCLALVVQILLHIPFILLFIWTISGENNWLITASTLTVCWLLFCLLMPYNLDHDDPVNDTVIRIQNKKAKLPREQQ